MSVAARIAQPGASHTLVLPEPKPDTVTKNERCCDSARSDLRHCQPLHTKYICVDSGQRKVPSRKQGKVQAVSPAGPERNLLSLSRNSRNAPTAPVWSLAPLTRILFCHEHIVFEEHHPAWVDTMPRECQRLRQPCRRHDRHTIVEESRIDRQLHRNDQVSSKELGKQPTPSVEPGPACKQLRCQQLWPTGCSR